MGRRRLELYLHPLPRQHTMLESLLAQLFHPAEKDIVVVRIMVGNRQTFHASHLRHLQSLRGSSVASHGIRFSPVSNQDIHPRMVPKPLR